MEKENGYRNVDFFEFCLNDLPLTLTVSEGSGGLLTIYSENALTLIACMSPNIFSYKTNFKETKVIFMQHEHGSFNNSVLE